MPSQNHKQAKVTTGTINFNYMRTAANTTLSPRSLRSMAKKVYKATQHQKTIQGRGANLHTTGLAAGPKRLRVRRMHRRRAGLVGYVSWANCSMVWAMAASTPVSKIAGG